MTEAAEVRSLPSRVLERVLDTLENPILLREMRAAFRRKRFVVLNTTLLAVVALVLLIAMFVMADTTRLDPSEIGRSTFLAFTGLEGALITLLFPAFSCTSITEERVARSFDLLVTTRLTPGQIILGKMLAAFIYGLLFIIATVPLVAITFLYGGVSPSQILLTYAGFLVQATLLTVYAIYVSSVAGSTLKAVVFTYLGVFLLMPLLLAPISYVHSIHVTGPLLKEASLVRMRDAVRDLDGINATLYWGGLVAFYGLAISLFYIVARNRIAPPTANRSTALRAWFAALVGLGLAGSLTFLVHNFDLPVGEGAPVAQNCLLVALGSVLVVFTLAAISFAGEDVVPPRRQRAAIERLRGVRRPLRLFMPGAVHGQALVYLALLATLGAIFAVFMSDSVGIWAAQAHGELRSGATLITWGTAWTLAFVFFLLQLTFALSNVIQHGVFARLWAGFVLIGLTFYPVFCFYLDPPTAKPRLWQGYYLSPCTVALSAVFEPRLPTVERQLVLFGPSGDEIKKEVTKLAETLAARPDIAALAPRERQETIARAKAARAEEMARIGVPVHEVSVWVYLALGVLVGAWNAVSVRALGKKLGPPPSIAVENVPAPEPALKVAAPASETAPSPPAPAASEPAPVPPA